MQIASNEVEEYSYSAAISKDTQAARLEQAQN